MSRAANRAVRLCLATIAAACCSASGAVAASYTQYACHLPSGGPTATDGFSASSTGAGTFIDDCASGEGLWLGVPQTTSSPTSAEWTYQAPADLSVSSVSFGRNVQGAGSTSNLTFALVGSLYACNSANPCSEWYDYAKVPMAGATSLAWRLSCPDSGCDVHATLGGAPAEGKALLSNVRIELDDNSPPEIVQPPADGLFDTSQPLRGTQSARFSARDVGGGLYRAWLVVDGVASAAQAISTQPSCAEPFTAAVPCPLSADSEVAFDTTTMSDGLHTVSLVISDATATNQAVYGPVQVRFENFPASGRLDGSAAERPNPTAQARARLAGIGRSAKKFRWQGSDKTSVALGRLLDENGKAIVGAPLQVFSVVDVPGAKETQMGDVATDAHGAFRFVVPKGPSRRITVRYGSAVSWSFQVRVRAPVKLLASKDRLDNGDKLMLTAHLSGVKVPARSADVAFQVRIGEQWRTFATRPISKQGIARVGHRFRVTYQRLTYRFRAVVVRRKTFPFANASSPPVAVQVN